MLHQPLHHPEQVQVWLGTMMWSAHQQLQHLWELAGKTSWALLWLVKPVSACPQNSQVICMHSRSVKPSSSPDGALTGTEPEPSCSSFHLIIPSLQHANTLHCFPLHLCDATRSWRFANSDSIKVSCRAGSIPVHRDWGWCHVKYCRFANRLLLKLFINFPFS